MNIIDTTIKKVGTKLTLELNADRLERLAASFGFFNDAFLESVKRAERDYRTGRTRKIISFDELA